MNSSTDLRTRIHKTHSASSVDEQWVYGIHPVQEVLKAGTRSVEKVLFAKAPQASELFEILRITKRLHIPYQVVGEQRINSLAGKNKHQGIMAMVGTKPYSTLKQILEIAEQKKETPLLVVADSVEDPRNLGALIRTSLAAGVHGILLPKQGGTGLTSTVAKASAGALETMNIARSSDIVSDLKWLASKEFKIIGLHSQAPHSYRAGTFDGPLVTVIGGENRAIRPHISRCCTDIVSIPIRPSCQSLNLSVAAGIFLFEVVHQRSLKSE